MKLQKTVNRRTVLKTIGAGAVGSVAFASSASADDRDKGNDYGNGNGIGAFLNDRAEWKGHPVWSDGIANRTGESQVEVTVGALTSLDIPDDDLPVTPPAQGPFSFDPMVVKVSPGTEVMWTWIAEHHSVTSYNPDADDPSDPTSTGDHGTLFDEHGEAPHTSSYTFDDPGTFLYFCHPHGTPYPSYDGFLDSLGLDPFRENLFGMRGAVLVSGR